MTIQRIDSEGSPVPTADRIVITDASEWGFDTALKKYYRAPRAEPTGPSGPVAYTGEWEPYDDLIPVVTGANDDVHHLVVVRPVPWGEGQLRQTGPIVSDTEYDR
jgi:hypothetical protein